MHLAFNNDSRVWVLFRFLCTLTLAVLVAAPASAQPRQPDTVVAADVDVLGGSLTYARDWGPGLYWGFDAGLGGAFFHRMLHGGSHFSDEGGPSYHAEDGVVDRALIEMVHVGVFNRWDPVSWFSTDVGARASLFVHLDASHESAAFPRFVGMYANAMVGWSRFKVGPRLLAGYFSETSSPREFGVYLVPVSARFSFGL